MAEHDAPALSPEQLVELLGLLRGVDSVELKLTVPESGRRSAVAALGIDPLEAQIRQVVFFDTPDLALNSTGVVVRARRVAGQAGDDSVVKLRPVVPDELPASVRKSPNFGVEVDAMPGGFVCSGSDEGRARSREGEGDGGRPTIRCGSSSARSSGLSTRRTRRSGLRDATTSTMLGPINVLKLKFTPGELGRRMVAEVWYYPDGSRILELSTKCAPGEAFRRRRRDARRSSLSGASISPPSSRPRPRPRSSSSPTS